MRLVISIVRACAVVALVAAANLGTAHALSVDDLMGRWCGDNIFSVFTRETLTVKFLRTQKERVLRIKQIVMIDQGTIKVIWYEEDGGGATDYVDFTGTSMAMAPQTNGDKGPRRAFHRC